MPYIDTKVTISLPDNKKEELKKELAELKKAQAAIPKI